MTHTKKATLIDPYHYTKRLLRDLKITMKGTLLLQFCEKDDEIKFKMIKSQITSVRSFCHRLAEKKH